MNTEPDEAAIELAAQRVQAYLDACESMNLYAATSQHGQILRLSDLRTLLADWNRLHANSDAERYGAVVNAPLPPEVVSALRTRLASGDVPRRSVREVPHATVEEENACEATRTAQSWTGGWE